MYDSASKLYELLEIDFDEYCRFSDAGRKRWTPDMVPLV